MGEASTVGGVVMTEMVAVSVKELQDAMRVLEIRLAHLERVLERQTLTDARATATNDGMFRHTMVEYK